MSRKRKPVSWELLLWSFCVSALVVIPTYLYVLKLLAEKEVQNLSREEFLLTTAIVAAAVAANALDSAADDESEIVPDSIARIKAAVAAQTSEWQRESLTKYL